MQARTVTATAPVLAPPPPATAPPTMHYQVVPANNPNSSGLGGLEYRLAELERKLDLLLQQRLGDLNPAMYSPQSESSRKQSLPRRLVPQAPATLPAGTQPPPLPPPTASAENTAPLPPQPAPRQEPSPFVSAPSPMPAPTAETIPPQPPSDTPVLPPTPVLAQTEPANQPPPLQPLPAAREAVSAPLQDLSPAVQNRPEPSDPAIDPFRPSKSQSDRGASPFPDRTSAREIEAQLGVAIRRCQRTSRLLEKKMISAAEYDSVLDEVRLLVAKLKGLIDELTDEIERSNVELLRKQAELQVAEAHQAATAAIVKRNARLNERKPGMVATEDVTKAEAEDAATVAQITVKGREVEEVHVRIRQLEKRREMLNQTLEKSAASVRSIVRIDGRTTSGPAVEE